MSDTLYCYPPDYSVLKNKLGLRDANELDRAERRLVTARLMEGVPTGDFDLVHLKVRAKGRDWEKPKAQAA